MVSKNKAWCLLLWGVVASGLSQAAGTLRIGVTDTDAPPIALVSADGQTLKGGLSKELGEALAAEMGLKPQFVLLARKRVETSVESGQINVICNSNPEWFGNAARLGWSHEMYPQIERAISLRNSPDIRQTDDMAGMRIGTIKGYSYPTLEHLWNGNTHTRRVEELRLELLLKGLHKGLIDVTVNSELEYVQWAKANSQEAKEFKVSPAIITRMPTMCAISPRSPYSVEKFNQAIDSMHRNGKLKAILRNYQWQPE